MAEKNEKLDSHALILNKSWTVIATTTVRDAIVLMSRNSAKGVCTDTYVTYTWEQWINSENPPKTDFTIKTPSIEIPAPQVIILTNYNDVYQATIKFSPKAVFKRDNYVCQYCKKRFKSDQLSIDHIIPRSKNGKNTFENCVTSCTPCNTKKANFDLNETGMNLARKPVAPKWNPVFSVKEELRPEAWKPLLKEEW